MVQMGLDFGSDHLRFGPIVSAAVASYGKVDEELKCTSFGCSGLSSTKASHDIRSDARAWHSYVFVGVRGNYRI